MRLTSTVFILVSSLLLHTNANSASFNCAKAKSKVEKAICGDNDLSKLDEQLSTAYKASLRLHPLPDYVKSRQRDWVSLNQYCDSSNLIVCLKKNYQERIAHLTGINNLTVYSNTKKFSYSNGDIVVEYWLADKQWKFSVWGGFVIHQQASEDNGKPTYVGCEFDGKMSNPNSRQAISSEGTKIGFKLDSNTLTFDENTDTEICAGFGRLPEGALEKVSKN